MIPHCGTKNRNAVSSVEEEITFEKSSEAAGATIAAEEEAVFESDDKSSVVPPSAVERKHEHELFGEEDFSMETLIDVDINTISPFLKDGAPFKDSVSAVKDSGSMEEPEVSLFEVSTDKEQPPKSGAKESLEVVIASNVSHTETPEKVESKATVSPEVTPVKEDDQSKKHVSKHEDAISEETTYTRAEDLFKKVSEEKPTDELTLDEDFVEMFEQAPHAEAPDKTTEHSSERASSGVTDADIEAFDRDEEIITGDDIANKIASLESQKPTASLKPTVKKEKKKEKAASGKTSAAKSLTRSGKKSSTSASSKKKKGDETITGDDVADKIDAFFGLFDK